MINKNNVLDIIKRKGPVIPRDIMKEIGGDTFLIGAVLSQLKSSHKIRVSNTKIGGSPVYYFSEQKQKLQNLYKYLHNKEKQAFDLLKEKGVLQDSELEPSIRVALRNIKDFAKPVEVNLKQKKIVFWRWYLLDNKEVESRIRSILLKKSPKPDPDEKQEEKQQKQTTPEKKETKKPNEKQKELRNRNKKKDTSEDIKKNQDEEDEKDDPFLKKIVKYFNNKDIEIINKEIVRKNREIDMTIRIPSAAGKLTYYCRARNIKKTNHGHLSTAYVEGQTRKLPILYMTTGELTKRAEEMLEQEFKNITIKKI